MFGRRPEITLGTYQSRRILNLIELELFFGRRWQKTHSNRLRFRKQKTRSFWHYSLYGDDTFREKFSKIWFLKDDITDVFPRTFTSTIVVGN